MFRKKIVRLQLVHKKYRAIDVLKLSYEVAPGIVTTQFFLSLMQSILTTAVMVMVTSLFIDTALHIFAGYSYSQAIYMPFTLLLLLTFFSSLYSEMRGLLSSKIKYAVRLSMQPALLEVEGSLAYEHLENLENNELRHAVNTYLEESFEAGLSAYVTLIGAATAIVTILGVIWVHAWWAVLVFGVFFAVIVAISKWAGKSNYEAEIEASKHYRYFDYYTEGMLTNREVVEERTLFAYAQEIIKRYRILFDRTAKRQIALRLKVYASTGIVGVLIILLSFVMAIPLVNPVLNGYMSVGQFMGVLVALSALASSLGSQVSSALQNIEIANEYMKDLTKFTGLSRCEGAKRLPDSGLFILEKLEFRNVYFTYPQGDNPVLNGLSFIMEGGKHYAFVGVNGAGKSTIIKLLQGLYDSYTGEILVNGKELRTYGVHRLKSLSAVAYQQFARYQVSFQDNIKLGSIAQEMDIETLKTVLLQTGLKETVDRLPNGLLTKLGRIYGEGEELSGGQWQRINIARTLVNMAPLKILDEPTSALDPIAESELYRDFESLMGDKTIIFISHRLASAKLASTIFVIDDGQIVETGNHQELMGYGGLYCKMFETQRGWYA